MILDTSKGLQSSDFVAFEEPDIILLVIQPDLYACGTPPGCSSCFGSMRASATRSGSSPIASAARGRDRPEEGRDDARRPGRVAAPERHEADPGGARQGRAPGRRREQTRVHSAFQEIATSLRPPQSVPGNGKANARGFFASVFRSSHDLTAAAAHRASGASWTIDRVRGLGAGGRVDPARMASAWRPSMLKGIGRSPFGPRPRPAAVGIATPEPPETEPPPDSPPEPTPTPPPARRRPRPAHAAARRGIRDAQAADPLAAGRPARPEPRRRDGPGDPPERDPHSRRAALRHRGPAPESRRAAAAGRRDPRRDLRLRSPRASAQGRQGRRHHDQRAEEDLRREGRQR